MKAFVRKHTVILALLVVILLTIPVILPFLHRGFFPSHDGEWTVVRLADMYRTVRDGQIPARYSNFLNMRYGYPLFNFAYPAPYYAGLIFVFLKIGFVNSIKLLFVLGTFASGIGMFLLSRKLWKSTLSGVISALLFVYLPYRMVDLYVRGSLGEIFALAVVPYLFLCMYVAIIKRSLLFAIVAGGFLGLLITSHNIMGLFFGPLLFIFASMTVWQHKKNGWRELVVTFLLGFGLSAFFLVPALTEKHLILLSKIPIADRSLYFVSVPQLVFPSWGYGVPTDTNHPFTYQLGIAQLLAFLLTLGVVVLGWCQQKKQSAEMMTAVTLSALVIAAILLLFPISRVIWELTPLFSEINYPWTLLAPIGFLVSLGMGFAAARRPFVYPAAGIAILAIVMVIPYARPESYIDRGDAYYVTNMATTTSSHEYTPLWVKEFPVASYEQKVVVASGTATILSDTAGGTTFRAETDTPTGFRVNTTYYPGWQLLIDGQSSALSYTNPHGVIEGKVPAGTHTIKTVFTETPLRQASDILTVMSFLIGVGLLVSHLFRYRHEKK